jgi:hypothetical protein
VDSQERRKESRDAKLKRSGVGKRVGDGNGPFFRKTKEGRLLLFGSRIPIDAVHNKEGRDGCGWAGGVVVQRHEQVALRVELCRGRPGGGFGCGGSAAHLDSAGQLKVAVGRVRISAAGSALRRDADATARAVCWWYW